MIRRSFLRTLAATAAQQPTQSLREVAARRNILYGATDELNGQKPPAAFWDLFARHCALLAPNLSSLSVWKGPDTHDFSRFQPVLDFAQDHKIKLTGAHLLWHQTDPQWLQAITDRKEAERISVKHIEYLCKRFGGQIYSWNVLNEMIEPGDHRPDMYRDSTLFRRFGTEVFDFAFHAAREADPHALLVYNDTSMEMDINFHDARRRALLRLLDDLKRRNVPIDAIGLQTHIKMAQFQFKPELYRRFLKEIAARGVQILITEMDVLDIGLAADIPARDQAVADAYRRVLDVALDEPAVSALVTWGLTDRYTWLTPRSGKKFERPDGLACRPLLFDDQFQPKPAYWAVLRALEAAPERPVRVRTW